MESMIDVAKSGRSKCQLCNELMPIDTLRVGMEVKDPYQNDYYPRKTITQWYHLKCAAKHKADSLSKAIKKYTGVIPELKEIEQIMVVKPIRSQINIKDFELLMEGCKNGDVDLVMSLIAKGIDINGICDEYKDGAYTPKGKTALMLSCEYGQIDIVKLLIENNADINAEDDFRTALIYASGRNYIDIVKLLIEKGADINALTRLGRETALIIASRLGYFDIVKLLIEKGVSINLQAEETAVISAVDSGHFEVVKILIENGADIYIEDFNGDDHHNSLYYAFKKGDEKIIKLLLDAVIAKDKGKTAIKQAVSSEYANKVKMIIELIKAGADYNVKVYKEKTLIEWAKWTSEQRVKEIVKYIEEIENKKWLR
jgi:ankyrin repeat protein